MTLSAWIRWGSLALVVGAGCSKDKPTPQAEPPVAPASAVVSAAPVVSAALVQPSATASAEAPAPVVTRSARPTALEWCNAPIAKLGYEGDDGDGTVIACKMIEVREWQMLWCPQSGRRQGGKDLGVYDRALPGGGSMANADELVVGPGGEATDAVIVSLRPGTKAKPTFTYRPQAHPEWLKDESFTVELAADAMSLSEHKFNGGAWPTFEKRDTSECERRAAEEKAEAAAKTEAAMKAELEADAKGVADVDGLAPAPADDAWAAEKKEALVTGSGAIGCTTKVIDTWFFMRCEGKVKPSAFVVEKGKRATQTKAVIEDGVVKLLTPYVEGTELRAKLTYEGGERFLKLRWGKGKRPYQVGTVGETR